MIQQATEAVTKDRTSFVIAHRLSTIENVDMILVMKNGDIVEKGTHSELLQSPTLYASLYNSQFQIA
ncbi:ABC transporter [Enterococcus faecium]|nr:ABC transporter [Enterococcus faecium]